MSMEQIINSELYQSRRPFTASDMAGVLGISKTRTMTWLRDMAYEGLVIASGDGESEFLLYAAPPRLKHAMMRRPWNRRLAREVPRACA